MISTVNKTAVVRICKKGTDIRLETQASLWQSHLSHDIRSKPRENLRHGKQQVQRSWGWGSKLSICRVQKEVHFRAWLITPGMRVVLGPHDNMNWESLCKLLFLLLMLMYYMFQDLWWHWTSHRVCQWQVWAGKEMQWKGFWCVWADSIKEEDVITKSNFYSSFFPPRKTRRADIVVSAAKNWASPWGLGSRSSRLSSIWEVSGGSDRKVGR